MEEITKRLEAMVLPIAAAVGNQSQDRVIATAPPMPNRDFTCYFCGGKGHTQPRCRVLEDMVANGQVHLNGMNRVCLGPVGSGNPPVSFPMDGTIGADHVRRLLSTSVRSPVRMRTAGVGTVRLARNEPMDSC